MLLCFSLSKCLLLFTIPFHFYIMKKLKSILLIDDDDITNYINSSILKRMGICNEIKIVKNGNEGLAYLNNFCKQNHCFPDLIIVDIFMPVMNGGEFLKELQNSCNFNDLKSMIVVLTNSSHPKDIKKMEELGISYILNKPLTKTKVTEILKINC